MTQSWRSSRVVVLLLVFGAIGEARADRIVLRGGGQVKGKVVADPRGPDRMTVIPEHGKTPLVFEKAKVLQIIAEPGPLDEYLPKRESAAATAQAQYDLGLWCEQVKLTDLAEVHYEAAIAHDKAFAPAHKKLGHVLVGDAWLGGDDLREARGLVRYKGKWVTREESQRQEKESADAAEQSSWTRRIRQLREAIVYGPDDRRREAESQLMALQDVAAVAPLVRVLGADSEAMRTHLAHALGAIKGAESASALVSLLLAEGDRDVRLTTMDELERRNSPEVQKQLARALGSKTPEVVNRAAWALANLKAVPTVPALVGALVTTKYEVVMAPIASGPSAGMPITATFGGGPIGSNALGAPIAYNGSSIAYLNGPVVGPGAVAFGATSVPLYPLPEVPSPIANQNAGGVLASTGINAGGGVVGTRGPVPQVVGIAVENTEVLAALVKLTGRDFGYDVAAWKRWLRTSFQPDPAPARHVPQP